MLKPLQELKNNAWFDPVAMTKLCIKRVEQVRNATIMVVGFWWTINGRRVFSCACPEPVLASDRGSFSWCQSNGKLQPTKNAAVNFLFLISLQAELKLGKRQMVMGRAEAHCGEATREVQRLAGKLAEADRDVGKETPFFAMLFLYQKTHHFTKTGSGQTEGKRSKKR